MKLWNFATEQAANLCPLDKIYLFDSLENYPDTSSQDSGTAGLDSLDFPMTVDEMGKKEYHYAVGGA